MADLWILAGQSNMEGVGRLGPAEPVDPRIRVFAHGDRWELAQEPLHWRCDAVDPVHWDVPEDQLAELRVKDHAERTIGAGCGLPFAKFLVENAGVDIALLPCAHGGTSMSQWNPELAGLGGRSLYGAMLRRTKLALQTGDCRLTGILWYQGESDCDPEPAREYPSRMRQFIAACRRDLDAPSLPFYIVQLGRFAMESTIDDPGADAWTQVRDAQRKLALDLPNVATVAAIDLELYDLIHVDTAGLKRLGRRLGNVALSRVYGKPAPQPLDISTVTIDDGAIRVTVANVTGRLIASDPAGRINGFSLRRGPSYFANAFFHAEVDPTDSAAIRIFCTFPVEPGDELIYAAGHNPFCQVIDSGDHALPAFGPTAIYFG